MDLIKQTVWHHGALSLLSLFHMSSSLGLWILFPLSGDDAHFQTTHGAACHMTECSIQLTNFANVFSLQFFCQQQEETSRSEQ